MISAKAIRQFLARKRANSDKAKRFTDRALDAMLARLDPPPRFRLPPFRHQKIAFLLGLKYGSYVFLLDMGLGKSKVALDLYNYRRRLPQHERPRMLVLVPGVANIEGWAEEAATHSPKRRYLALDETLDTEARRAALLRADYDIACITYQGWAQLVSTPKVRRQRGKRSKSHWVLDKKKAKALGGLFSDVVCDESDAIQNPTGLFFRMVRRLSRQVDRVLCMTGTPFNKSPESLWAQFYVVDRGYSLGEHIGLFRQTFFLEEENYWSGLTWEFDERMEEELHRALRHRSLRFSEDECLDLPPRHGGLKKPVILSAPMPPENQAHYDRMVKELKDAHASGNRKMLENVYTRLRMLCAGYLPTRDDKGQREDILLPLNPKLDLMVEVLRQIPADRKVIVFCVYRTTGNIICDRLTQVGIPHARLYGGTRDKRGVIRRFKTEPVEQCRVLVASRSGCKGHNLQVADWEIFYETPDDVIGRTQAEKRIRRPGQTRRTHYVDLHIRDSIDGRILASLQAGQRLFDRIVEGKGAVERLVGLPKPQAAPRGGGRGKGARQGLRGKAGPRGRLGAA